MAGWIVVDPTRFAAEAAEQIGGTLHRMSGGRRDLRLGLSGGTTLAPVYEHLAALESVSLNWNAMSFYFGDERAVPPDHPDSNYRLARETLLSRIPAAPERIHRMEAEQSDLDRAAREYDALLPLSLDLLLLGMGVDGHVASLFPGSPALAEAERRVVPVSGGMPRVARLTITPPVLAQAKEIIVMVNGLAKGEAVARALEGPLDPFACPAQLVRRATWILDHPAARRLRRAS
jgi:6-phosphogluconolactonase